MTPESKNSSLLGNGSVNRFPQIYTNATTEELPFLCNGEVTTHL
jgi:hypothetical protein